MKAAIKNTSRALQGVHTTEGLAFIEPGSTRTLDVADDYVERVNGLPFLEAKWHDAPAKAAKPSTTPKAPAPAKAVKPPVDDTPKTPAEVLAMGADKDVQFLAFRSAATKLLGDKTPAKKDEIILALEELATQP
jgi:hypothetical protein